MQAAFIVSFPSDFPSADDVARSVTGIFGEQPHATAAAFREGVWALTLKSGAGERVVVEFHPQHRNAVIEVDSPADQQDLPTAADVEIHWVNRAGSESDDPLGDAVRALPIPGGATYAWGGAEHGSISALGRYLRRTCGMRAADVSTVGYWAKHGFQ